MTKQNKQVMQWFDNQLVRIEKEAERVGYDIDSDATYINICQELTDIEWGSTKPTTQVWVGIAYLVGIVQQRINEKQ